MSTTPTSSRHPTRSAFTRIAASALVATVCTAVQAADADVTVTAVGYRWADRSFDDLASLEAAVMPRTPQTVRLDACGVGAVAALKTAAYRFRHLQLELRLVDDRAAACAAPQVASLAPTALPALSRPSPTEAFAAERWWEQTMP